MKLHGQVAIVTGGATGMGRAISERLAAEGARVVVNYRASADAAKDVVKSIQMAGGEAVAHAANVQTDAEVRSMVDSVEDRWGRLDVLVNNAGWSKLTPHWQLDDLTDEIWDRTLNTNLRGAFYCCRAAVPLMRKNGGGSIVNNASASAYSAAGSSIVYSASKAGMVNMTKSLARALAPDIRVNAIAPGLGRNAIRGLAQGNFRAWSRGFATGANRLGRGYRGHRALPSGRRKRSHGRDNRDRLRSH